MHQKQVGSQCDFFDWPSGTNAIRAPPPASMILPPLFAPIFGCFCTNGHTIRLIIFDVESDVIILSVARGLLSSMQTCVESLHGGYVHPTHCWEARCESN